MIKRMNYHQCNLVKLDNIFNMYWNTNYNFYFKLYIVNAVIHTKKNQNIVVKKFKKSIDFV